MKRVAIMPLRGGSKGIPSKNLIEFEGKPLFLHALKAAYDSSVDRVYVSTNSNEIASIAASNDVPVISQPDEISTDTSCDYDVFRFIAHHRDMFDVDYFVHVRATFPRVTSEIIDDAMWQFEESYDDYDSLRSVIRSPITPYKMWRIDMDGSLTPVIDGNALHSSPRQTLPVAYWQNACVDIVKRETILGGSMIGQRCMPFLMSPDADGDIDTLADLERVANAKGMTDGR